MKANPRVVAILADEEGPAADRALLGALKTAEPVDRRLIVTALLNRSQTVGLTGLVEHFHHLDELGHLQVMEHADKVSRVLRTAARSSDDQARLNVMVVIRTGKLFRSAYLAEAALHDRSSRVREAAAETLHDLADALLSSAEDETSDLARHLEDRRQIVCALEAGVAAFGVHHHPRVLEAALWFADDMSSGFWTTISVLGSRAARVVVAAIGYLHDPRLVCFCMGALNYAALRPHVARALAECESVEFLHEWIRQSWRLAEPRLAKAAVAVKELTLLNRQWQVLEQIEPDSQRHLARWVGALGVAEPLKIQVCRHLLGRQDRSLARSAVRTLMTIPGERATAMLQSVAGGADESLARLALIELARRSPLEYPPSVLCGRRKRPAVNAPAAPDQDDGGEDVWGDDETKQARQESPPAEFDRFWSRFDRLNDEDRRKNWTELVLAEPAARESLAAMSRGSDLADRMRFVQVVRICGLHNDYAEEICHLAQDPSAEVRSAAVIVAGRLPRSITGDLLNRALSDQDQRVQANAVEAIGDSQGEAAIDDLLPKLSSPDNRVRANAVKALLQLGVREAAETLLRMLQDPNRAHRVSALWLIERMDLISLMSQVMEMAHTDADDKVRQRAQALNAKLPGRQGTSSEVAGGVPSTS